MSAQETAGDGGPCPNCGGTENQIDDDGHRICWECGTRWSK